MANVVTTAETNVIKKAQMAKVRELDFAQLFGENVQNLLKMLGVTRKIPVTAGTALKVLKVTGTLQSGIVGEGEIIPLSQYSTTYETVAEATLQKWRKATTAEAILKGGYDQAVNETDKKLRVSDHSLLHSSQQVQQQHQAQAYRRLLLMHGARCRCSSRTMLYRWLHSSTRWTFLTILARLTSLSRQHLVSTMLRTSSVLVQLS